MLDLCNPFRGPARAQADLGQALKKTDNTTKISLASSGGFLLLELMLPVGWKSGLIYRSPLSGPIRDQILAVSLRQESNRPTQRVRANLAITLGSAGIRYGRLARWCERGCGGAAKVVVFLFFRTDSKLLRNSSVILNEFRICVCMIVFCNGFKTSIMIWIWFSMKIFAIVFMMIFDSDVQEFDRCIFKHAQSHHCPLRGRARSSPGADFWKLGRCHRWKDGVHQSRCLLLCCHKVAQIRTDTFGPPPHCSSSRLGEDIAKSWSPSTWTPHVLNTSIFPLNPP